MSLLFLRDSIIFKLIFRFSVIKEVLCELLACIPPTFAAALIIKLGFNSKIKDEVSSKLNKFASFLVAAKTSFTFSDFDKTLFKEEPTNPALPNIITLTYTLST